MKKQIIAGTVLATIALSGAYAYAGETKFSTGNTKAEISNFEGKSNFFNKMNNGGKHSFSKMGEGRGIDKLTDEEKTALASMSDTEKKAFFNKKMLEAKAKQEARENVIDKLLAGTSLSSDEEILRAEIIKERAEMKARKTEMEAKMAEMKTIMEKKKAGTTLTIEEQAVLDSMKSNMKKGKMGEKKGMGGMMK